MPKKTLRFSGNQLILEGISTFTVANFELIKDSEMETHDVSVDTEKKETLSVKKVSKEISDERFVRIYINQGDKYPYPPKVIDAALNEHDNPRPPEQIELDEQLFILVDIKTQRIWISDQRKKTEIANWLAVKLHKKVIVKSIINEREFIEKMESVSQISFSIMPDLFNSSDQDILSNNLVKDIYGFGAEKARMEFSYNNSRISDKIKEKFYALIKQSNNFQEITVIGRSDENLDTVFNVNEVVARLFIEVGADAKSKLVEEGAVFSSLIGKIKETQP